MNLLDRLLESYICVDAYNEVLYGSDQIFMSYPCRFATVNIELITTDGLWNVVVREREERTGLDIDELDGYYNFYIGLNDYSETKMDSFLEFVVYESSNSDNEQSYYIDLSDEEQRAMYRVLDKRCKEQYGKGCDELLAEAREAMEED